MRKLVILALATVFSGGAQASWYWPFGSDSDAVDEKPQRVSELVEQASLLIEDASDLAAEGKIDEAVGKYREALTELNNVEADVANRDPERAKSAEFATLRNKRAYVNAAIDSLLLGQVRSNAKTVAVSDTTELERRLDRERWGKRMDKASEELSRCNADKALDELTKAKAGTTNAVMIAITHVAVAGACCQKKDLEGACWSLTLSRQALERTGVQTNELAMTEEEKRLVAESLLLLRRRIVDGHRETVRAGRRVCADCVRLKETDDLTSSNAVALAKGVVSSLALMQENLSVLAFPEARHLSRVSSNLWLRSTKLLARMKAASQEGSIGQGLMWNIDAAGLRSALNPIEVLTPEIRDLDTRLVAVLRLVKKVPAEKKAPVEKKLPAENRKPARFSKPAQSARRAQSSQPLTKRGQVLVAIEKGEWTTAERLIGEMLVSQPNGAVPLNLKAAMEARQGKFKEAEETLDQAILSNPRNYFAYYNMANLMLKVRSDDKSVAERYYKTGRAFGGPVDAHLEDALK